MDIAVGEVDHEPLTGKGLFDEAGAMWKKQKFAIAAAAAVGAVGSPRGVGSPGADDGSGRKEKPASWMGRSLTRPQVSRQDVRVACDRHGNWRRQWSAQQAEEEAKEKHRHSLAHWRTRAAFLMALTAKAHGCTSCHG